MRKWIKAIENRFAALYGQVSCLGKGAKNETYFMERKWDQSLPDQRI